jgi:hypothetical protein
MAGSGYSAVEILFDLKENALLHFLALRVHELDPVVEIRVWLALIMMPQSKSSVRAI